MLNLLLLTLFFGTPEPFKESIFRKNFYFYDSALSTKHELNDLETLHLLCLRLMINERLGDETGAYKDSCEIYDMTINDSYLMREWQIKYKD